MTKLELIIGVGAVLVWGAAMLKMNNDLKATSEYRRQGTTTGDEGETLYYDLIPVTRNTMTRVNGNGGVPKTDIERAMNHYGITLDEYLNDPGSYPLPPRGTGLSR